MRWFVELRNGYQIAILCKREHKDSAEEWWVDKSFEGIYRAEVERFLRGLWQIIGEVFCWIILELIS